MTQTPDPEIVAHVWMTDTGKVKHRRRFKTASGAQRFAMKRSCEPGVREVSLTVEGVRAGAATRGHWKPAGRESFIEAMSNYGVKPGLSEAQALAEASKQADEATARPKRRATPKPRRRTTGMSKATAELNSALEKAFRI